MGIESRGRRRSGTSAAASARQARDAAAGDATRPQLPEFTAEESLSELKELAQSAGAQVTGEYLQSRERPDPATLIGRGKLEEIAGAAASAGANLLIFDHDLSPSQQRNVEEAVGTRVIDRTQLIQIGRASCRERVYVLV